MTSKMNGSDRVEAFLRSADDIAASSSSISEDDRMRVLLKLYEITTKVETPWDTFMRVFLDQTATSCALKILKDLRLFPKWHQHRNRPMTENELAELTGGSCDPELLHRLLRLLAANHLVAITPEGKFMPLSFCTKLADPEFDKTAQFYYDYTGPLLHHMPAFLAETDYVNPRSNRTTVFDSLFNWKGGLFKYFNKHPAEGELFNIVQKVSTSSQSRWTSVFPCDTLLDSDSSLPLLVDVGGNIGQDIQAFYEKYPETASRLYLEDLPAVLADEKGFVMKGVNKVEYDFFTPQPIRHARAYYMHHILHDWPDKQSRKILENQKAAMKPGYSRLLIHDHVINESGPLHPHATSYDVAMMVFGAAKERTETEWEELVKSAGLKIVKIWRVPSSVQSVIEVEVDAERPNI